MDTSAGLERALKVNVDATRTKATVRLFHAEDYTTVPEQEVREALEAASVDINETVVQRINEMLAFARSERFVEDTDFTLAEGTLPTDPTDGQFVFSRGDEDASNHDTDETDDGAAINFFAQCKIRTTQEGDVIGVYTAAQHGRSGTDVSGHPIPPKRKPADIEFGDNVLLDGDGKTVRATAAGRVHYVGWRLSVQPMIEIKGNVDFETGSVESPTDVVIRGDVQDGFHVSSEKNISIGGSVDAADIKASGDLQVRSGIAGRNKGTITVGGQVAIKFCNEATIRAEGDITVGKEIINSTIHTNGKLLMPRGQLIGGSVYAREGGILKIIGTEAGTKTKFILGLDPDVLSECRGLDDESEKRRQTIEKIRTSVEPLLRQLKRLTPSQRERATELMYEVDRLEASINELQQQKEAKIEEAMPEDEPFLRIITKIMPGTMVVIGNLLAQFHKELKGPVKIERRRVERVTEVVAVSDLTGSVTPLHSCEYRPDDA